MVMVILIICYNDSKYDEEVNAKDDERKEDSKEEISEETS